MNLEQIYQYMKDRYGITHSFPRFVENAEKKGLTKEHQYLELIVSVLVSMKLYKEAVSEVIEEAVRESLDETLALETHIRGLELDYEELQGKYSELLKLSEMDGMELLAKVQSLKKLVRDLRAKKDPEPRKKLERLNKILKAEVEGWSNKFYKEWNKATELEHENKQLKEELRRLEISYNHVQQQRDTYREKHSKALIDKMNDYKYQEKRYNELKKVHEGVKASQISLLEQEESRLVEYAKLAKEKQHVINNAHELKKYNKHLKVWLEVKNFRIRYLQKQARDWQSRYNELKLEQLEKENKKFTNKLRNLFKKK